MSGLHANTGGMNNDGKQTVANAEYFLEELSSLGNNINGLMGIWKGPSSSAFNNSYLEQNQNFQNFQILLNELGEAISKAATHLNNTEEENTSKGSHLFG